MRFIETDGYFILEEGSQGLRIDRQQGTMSVLKEVPPTGRDIAGCIGTIQLQATKYLILAIQTETIGDLDGHSVNKVTRTEIIPYQIVFDSVDMEYLGLLRAHLRKAPLYFSDTWDLTNSLQRAKPFRYVADVADDRFFWNKYVSLDILSLGPDAHRFVLPLIFGLYSVAKTSLNGVPVEFGIISRRSRYRAGTRFFRRGIDESGHVANFNETEQILVVKGKRYSFVQTRGSVPAVWGQVNQLKYTPSLRVSGYAQSIDAARKHFEEQEAIYGAPQFLVNLVNQSGYERPVKEVYEQVVTALEDPNLQYIYFDFHRECSKMRWDRVSILLDELRRRGLDKVGWFETDRKTVVKVQDGTVRTNCMDCLDRTNVVQSCVALACLERQLEDAGVFLPGRGSEVASNKDFMRLFRNIWADNADSVSVAYSGTGALKTDFTRTGTRTRAGALQDGWNSAVRYVLNNFRDGPRQDGFSLFLGEHDPLGDVISPFIDRRPLATQSVPYIFCGSALVGFLSILWPSPNHGKVFNFFVSLFFLVAAARSFTWMVQHGLQFVNWPNLVPVNYVHLQKDHYEVTGNVEKKAE